MIKVKLDGFGMHGAEAIDCFLDKNWEGTTIVVDKSTGELDYYYTEDSRIKDKSREFSDSKEWYRDEMKKKKALCKAVKKNPENYIVVEAVGGQYIEDAIQLMKEHNLEPEEGWEQYEKDCEKDRLEWEEQERHNKERELIVKAIDQYSHNCAEGTEIYQEPDKDKSYANDDVVVLRNVNGFITAFDIQEDGSLKRLTNEELQEETELLKSILTDWKAVEGTTKKMLSRDIDFSA